MASWWRRLPDRPLTISRRRGRSCRSMPHCWRGALLPNSAFVVIEVLEGDKRPVAAVADHDEARDVRRVEVLSDKTISMRMLFDPGHSLEERILREQFGH